MIAPLDAIDFDRIRLHGHNVFRRIDEDRRIGAVDGVGRADSPGKSRAAVRAGSLRAPAAADRHRRRGRRLRGIVAEGSIRRRPCAQESRIILEDVAGDRRRHEHAAGLRAALDQRLPVVHDSAARRPRSRPGSPGSYCPRRPSPGPAGPSTLPAAETPRCRRPPRRSPT